MGFLQNVAVQWLVRRVPEWGGIIAAIIATIALAPPDVSGTITAILTGQGGGQSVAAWIGVISWVYAQVISYRSTVKPQAVVEENGKLVTNTLAPAKEREVKTVVEHVSSKKTLLDLLVGR